ncbi:ETEC_3214 domain-containing protein [Shewanella baltica]|uniref:ETEC_3214 domain-containing protein n=1 Tax=Shewanella baltica TaxID=62322 RepID=UPI00217DF4A3|nr:ETEC_3214 domain-containing protein [Shewanella baltica]MCS6203642.1 hypothetical protein [Shewanella baltica]
MKGLMDFILQVATGNNLHKDESDAQSSGWFSGVIRFIVFCAFLLMGLGNWSDSKQLLTEAYQGFITNFTHRIEDKTIANIHIGNYLNYIEKSLGIPQVIKVSERQNGLEYRYYKKNKYLLVLIAQEQRIAAMMLHTLPTEDAFLDRFNPSIPFTEHRLISSSIAEAIGSSNEFFFDNHNLAYFMKSKQMSAKGMGHYLIVGATEYQEPKVTMKDKLDELEEASMLEEQQDIAKLTTDLSQQQSSFFAISEVSPVIVADALLTKYEFNAYFKGK